MEFHNKTQCPTEILKPLFRQAARAVGVDTTQPLRVKITQGRSGRISGVACNSDPIEIKVVLPKNPTVYGLVENRPLYDSIDLAIRFWRIVAHEWGHVLDFQANRAGEKREFTHYKNGASMRAMRHDDRPHEKRAEEYARLAEARSYYGEIPGFDDAVLDLALWFDKSNS